MGFGMQQETGTSRYERDMAQLNARRAEQDRKAEERSQTRFKADVAIGAAAFAFMALLALGAGRFWGGGLLYIAASAGIGAGAGWAFWRAGYGQAAGMGIYLLAAVGQLPVMWALTGYGGLGFLGVPAPGAQLAFLAACGGCAAISRRGAIMGA